MIQFANKGMIPYLKKIWKDCFFDDDSYIDFYFANRFREDNMLVLLEDGIPISMLSMLPASLVLHNHSEKEINYIYAVATQPEHRRKGYGGMLLKHALDLSEKKNQAAILLPADQSLREYYKKSGFFDAFHLSKVLMQVNKPELRAMESGLDTIEIADILPEEYKKLRDNCFYKEGYVCWDMEAVKYAMMENEVSGGRNKKLLYKNKEYGILYYIEENKLHIKEVTALGGDAEKLAEKLAEYLECKEVELYSEASCSSENHIVENAMASESLAGYQFGYFNLSLG